MIYRSKLTEQIVHSLEDSCIQLIHVWGIAGSGKTTAVRDALTRQNHPTYEFDCRNPNVLVADYILTIIAKKTLGQKDYQKWHQAWIKRIENEIYPTIYQDKRYHNLSVSGTLIADQVIVGDVKHKSEEQEKREIWFRASIGLDELVKTIEKVSKQFQKVILVFDAFENVQNSDEICLWLSNLVKLNCLRFCFKIIIISRTEECFQIDPNNFTKIHVGPLELQEAHLLLIEKGVDSEETRSILLKLSQRHALSLTLASQVKGEFSKAEISSGLLEAEVSEELVTQFFLERIIKSEKNEVLRTALRSIPIFRYFSADTVQRILNIDSENSSKIIDALRQRGFVETIGHLYKYHDLLRSLTLNYLEKYEGHEVVVKLHGTAAEYYSSTTPSLGEELIFKIEGFYHLFREDPRKALPYFENLCKNALDRGNRVLSGALLSQVDYTILAGNIKGWYLLRLGGYFRQFRNFPRAIELFGQVVELAGNDQKLLAYALNNLGWCFLYFHPEENIERAIKYFEDSNFLCKKLGLYNVYGMNLNNLGIAYGRKVVVNTQNEISLYRKSLSITDSKKYKDPLVAAMSYRNMAGVYETLGDHQMAAQCYSKSLARYQEAQSVQGEGETLLLIGNLFNRLKQFDNSRHFLDIALSRIKISQDPYYLSETLFTLAMVLDKLNEIDNMIQCLASQCISSLRENWQYHEITVSRFIQFTNYLLATRGLEVVRKVLQRVIEIWNSDENCSQIKQFPDLIESYCDRLNSMKYWKNRNSKVIHLIGNRKCIPKQWDSTILVINDSSGRLTTCKRCANLRSE